MENSVNFPNLGCGIKGFRSVVLSDDPIHNHHSSVYPHEKQHQEMRIRFKILKPLSRAIHLLRLSGVYGRALYPCDEPVFCSQLPSFNSSYQPLVWKCLF